MQHGEVHAWHYATRRPVKARWRGGVFQSLRAVQTEPPDDVWIAPALVDLQVNGFAGVDFQSDELTGEHLRAAVRGLRAAGCGRFLLTLVTDDWRRLTARLRRLANLRRKLPELRRAIAGWHIEGPFLSGAPGYHGAHNPKFMLDPTPGHLRELRSITGAEPLLLTMDPERRGALEAIALARELGVKVNLGHTNASSARLREAVKAGATGFTHLGNACPQELDRHDNIVWRVLDTPGLGVSLIPDGLHVSPALFRLIHRVLGDRAICYTTDAMAAAGAPPGRYSLGPLTLEVGADQIVRQPGRTNFAGSALRPIDGVFCAAGILNRPWQEVWDGFSQRPARFLGLCGDLRAGQLASFCLLRFGPNGVAPTVETFVEGIAPS